jgi:hypothetical protein
MRATLDGVITSLRELGHSGSVDEFAERGIDLLWDLIPSQDLSFNELDERRRKVDFFRLRTVQDVEEESEEAFWAYADDLPICSQWHADLL